MADLLARPLAGTLRLSASHRPHARARPLPLGRHDPARYVRYHDEEWGVPVHDDRLLFEFLILEGAQAGLSWSTILRKRDNYRRAFAGFDAAQGGALRRRATCARLLADPGIVRNRLKIDAADRQRPRRPRGAGGVRQLRRATSGASSTAGRCATAGVDARQVPAETDASDAMSKELRGAASASSARPSATPSCRRPAWSTTTSSTASATARWPAPADRPKRKRGPRLVAGTLAAGSTPLRAWALIGSGEEGRDDFMAMGGDEVSQHESEKA